ncbi:MAG: pirin family protein, partial [Candidatus Thorarchaeota archaeon]
NGRVRHGDSLGNSGIIGEGDVQWMTAGSGIIHEEMPERNEGGLAGFQLWANLPSHSKMMHPRYRDIKNDDIPEVELDTGTRVRVICGEVQGVHGPVQDIVTDPEYLDVIMAPRSVFKHAVNEGYTVFAYLFEGSAFFEPLQRDYLEEDTLVLFNDGSEIEITSGKEGARFLLISGKPLREPIAWRGPIVMNTDEELRNAFDEYQRGTFLKHADK